MYLCVYVCYYVCLWFLFKGNNQKKAKTIIDASHHKMIAVEDFNMAAKTVNRQNTCTRTCTVHSN